MTKVITIEALKQMNVDTFSKQVDTVRGIETVSKMQVKVGDKVVLDNYFTLVIENDVRLMEQELERMTVKRNNICIELGSGYDWMLVDSLIAINSKIERLYSKIIETSVMQSN